MKHIEENGGLIMKQKRKYLCLILTIAMIFSGSFLEEKKVYAANQVSVHDPSIVKANGMYYVFGSHMAWAKSTDLENWTTFTNNINTDYASLYGNVWENWCKYNNSGQANKDNSGNDTQLNENLWAPDVIYNKEMKKWCMYMSNNGPDYNSVITMATADNVEGPYTYAGEVVYSGFTNKQGVQGHNVQYTDYQKVTGSSQVDSRYLSNENWNNRYGTNAIDPSVKYDENGDLWMTYGSWFGGIYCLKLDSKTGLRDYSYRYSTVEDESDEYLGKKIAGGRGVSGEASYIVKNGDYWYLFVSYGGLVAKGGYNIRVFRSKNLTGPYVDEKGNSAIYKTAGDNINGDVGYKLFGNYKWSEMEMGEVAQGHNSAFVDEDGKMYVVYHTRYDNGTEWHNLRTHQLYMNAEGWPVAAINDYHGETISENGYGKEEMVGNYRVLYHKEKIDYANLECATEQEIVLNEDGTISGAYQGKWSYTEGKAYMSLEINGVTYHGVFAKGSILEQTPEVMTFTASGGNESIWGKKVDSANKILEYNFNGNIGNGTTVGSKISQGATSQQPAYVEGKHGQAVHFSGEGSDGISLGNFPAEGTYSISFWYQLEESAKYTPMIFIENSIEDQDAQWLSIASQGWQENLTDGPMVWSRDMKVGTEGTWYDLTPTEKGTVKTGQWQNCILTVTEGTGSLYIDGKLVGTGNVANCIGKNSQIFLGVNNWDTPLKGAIDELTIYDGIVSAKQISNLSSGIWEEEPQPETTTESVTEITTEKIETSTEAETETETETEAATETETETETATEETKATTEPETETKTEATTEETEVTTEVGTEEETTIKITTEETKETESETTEIEITTEWQSTEEATEVEPTLPEPETTTEEATEEEPTLPEPETTTEEATEVEPTLPEPETTTEEATEVEPTLPEPETTTEEATEVEPTLPEPETTTEEATEVESTLPEPETTTEEATEEEPTLPEPETTTEEATEEEPTLPEPETTTEEATEIESTSTKEETNTTEEASTKEEASTTEETSSSEEASTTEEASASEETSSTKEPTTENRNEETSSQEPTTTTETVATTTAETTTVLGTTTTTEAASTLTENSNQNTDTKLQASSLVVKAAGYLGKKITLKKGKKVRLQASVLPNAASQKVLFSSSKTAVATVNAKGIVKARKTGSTYITIRTEDGKKKVRYKICVVGKNKQVTDFKLKKTRIRIRKGKTVQLQLKKITKNGTSKFLYKSQNSRIASIDRYGVIRAVKNGTTSIRVICGSKRQQIKVICR